MARPFVSSSLVLAETYKLVLYRRGARMAGEVLRRILGAEHLTLRFPGPAHHARALEHLAALGAAKVTYEDATSFAIMESERIAVVLGFDSDFRLAGFCLASDERAG